tara:strand:- start:52341 stop:52442 length:102 start_codon:yes stop_codon:yes gene_type:complete
MIIEIPEWLAWTVSVIVVLLIAAIAQDQGPPGY